MDALWLVPLGAAVGAFGALVGAGGGFVLMPLLLLAYPDADHATLASVSLLMVSVNAGSASVAYARQGRIDVRSGLVFAATAIPGAVAGAVVVTLIARGVFEGLFAAVLAAAGVYLFLAPESRTMRDPLTGRGIVVRLLRDREGNTFIYRFRLWQGMALSTCVGFFSSLLGVGGGFIHVPLMTGVLRFPVHIATATSTFVLLFAALEGTAVHILTGHLGWDEWLWRAVMLSLGAVVGAQAGARIARRLRPAVITRVLATALVGVAARLALQAV